MTDRKGLQQQGGCGLSTNQLCKDIYIDELLLKDLSPATKKKAIPLYAHCSLLQLVVLGCGINGCLQV